MLQVLAGYDPSDPNSVDRPVPDYFADIERGVGGLRVGVMREHHFAQPDAGTEAAFDAAVAQLRDLGAVGRRRLDPVLPGGQRGRDADDGRGGDGVPPQRPARPLGRLLRAHPRDRDVGRARVGCRLRAGPARAPCRSAGARGRVRGRRRRRDADRVHRRADVRTHGRRGRDGDVRPRSTRRTGTRSATRSSSSPWASPTAGCR